MTMMPNNDSNGSLIHSMNDVLTLIMGESNLSETENEASSQAFEQLTVAAQSGDREFLKQLIEADRYQGEGDRDQPTVLMSAVMAKQMPVIRALLEAGAPVNETYTQFFVFDALSLAVSDRSTEIVQILLDAGADPNLHNQSPGLTPIRKACENGDIDIVRSLLQAGAGVKFGTGFRLLTDTAEKSTSEILQLLIDAGCNVNTRDQDTPLTAACRLARVEMVEALLRNGANPNKSGMHEMMPLTMVFLAPSMLGALEHHGLAKRPEELNDRIGTILSILLEAGADPNTCDVNGLTPFMLAVLSNNFDAAELLMRFGAEVDRLTQPNTNSIFLHHQTIAPKSLLELAQERNNQEAIDFLAHRQR